MAVTLAGALVGGIVAYIFFCPDADGYIRRFQTIAAFAGGDYVNMYVGAKLAVAGQVRTLFDIPAYQDALHQFVAPLTPSHNWSYPPHLLLFVWPLALVPYLWGFALWSAVTFAALVAAIRHHNARGTFWIVIAVALSPASIVNFVDGQNGYLTATLLLGGLRLIDRRPVIAGILFGCLTIKPQLGIVLPFLLIALGKWRVIAAAMLTTVALVVASLAMFGLQTWIDYLNVTGAYQLKLLEAMRGFYALMMPSPFAAARLLGFGNPTAWLLQAIVGAGAIFAAVAIVRRSPSFEVRALAVAAATILAGPYVLAYDMVAVTAAIALYIQTGLSRSPLLSAGMTFTWLLPALLFGLMILHMPVGPLVLLALLLGIFRLTSSASSCGIGTTSLLIRAPEARA